MAREPPSPAPSPPRTVAVIVASSLLALAQGKDRRRRAASTRARPRRSPRAIGRPRAPSFRRASSSFGAPARSSIAKCREHDGKLTLAIEGYRSALAANRETVDWPRVAEQAEAAVSALELRVGKLRVVVPSRPAGLAIKRDGDDFPVGALGELLPIDPGTGPSWKRRRLRGEPVVVTIAEGKTAEVRDHARARGGTAKVVPVRLAAREARPAAGSVGPRARVAAGDGQRGVSRSSPWARGSSSYHPSAITCRPRAAARRPRVRADHHVGVVARRRDEPQRAEVRSRPSSSRSARRAGSRSAPRLSVPRRRRAPGERRPPWARWGPAAAARWFAGPSSRPAGSEPIGERGLGDEPNCASVMMFAAMMLGPKCVSIPTPMRGSTWYSNPAPRQRDGAVNAS